MREANLALIPCKNIKEEKSLGVNHPPSLPQWEACNLYTNEPLIKAQYMADYMEHIQLKEVGETYTINEGRLMANTNGKQNECTPKECT